MWGGGGTHPGGRTNSISTYSPPVSADGRVTMYALPAGMLKRSPTAAIYRAAASHTRATALAAGRGAGAFFASSDSFAAGAAPGQKPTPPSRFAFRAFAFSPGER